MTTVSVTLVEVRCPCGHFVCETLYGIPVRHRKCPKCGKPIDEVAGRKKPAPISPRSGSGFHHAKQ